MGYILNQCNKYRGVKMEIAISPRSIKFINCYVNGVCKMSIFADGFGINFSRVSNNNSCTEVNESIREIRKIIDEFEKQVNGFN